MRRNHRLRGSGNLLILGRSFSFLIGRTFSLLVGRSFSFLGGGRFHLWRFLASGLSHGCRCCRWIFTFPFLLLIAVLLLRLHAHLYGAHQVVLVLVLRRAGGRVARSSVQQMLHGVLPPPVPPQGRHDLIARESHLYYLLNIFFRGFRLLGWRGLLRGRRDVGAPDPHPGPPAPSLVATRRLR